MPIDQAIAFFVFSVVAAITPGPSNAMILSTGSAVGAVRGLPCVLGASTGMGILLFASALGLGQIVLAQPQLLQAMKWAGAAFLLWLAWKIATSGSISNAASTPAVGFVGAAVFQWVNPKGWLVAVSAAGAYLQTGKNQPLDQALTFGAVFFCASLPSGLAWLALGAVLHSVLKDERIARVFNTAMALALAASVLLVLV